MNEIREKVIKILTENWDNIVTMPTPMGFDLMKLLKDAGLKVVESGDSNPLLFTNWHNSKEIPTLLFDSEGVPEDMSEDVLIDVDGNRKTFRVGYYDIDFETKEGTWILYGDEPIDIELDHMRWTNLPLASRDKK